MEKEADMEMNLSREEKRILIEEKIRFFLDDHNGIMKTADLEGLGIDYRRILALTQQGILTRIKSGYYTLSSENYSQDQLVWRMFPDGILTMESALFVYGYIEKKPYNWTIAISKNTSKSRFNVDYPILEPYYTEPEVLELGVTTARIGDGEMKIYTRDRLICDVLKYQEKLDRETVKSALRGYINDPKKDVAALMEFAKERKVVTKVQYMIGVWL